MKLPLVLTMFTLLQAVGMAQVPQSSLRLEVKVESDVDNKGRQNETKTQHRKLDMVISNMSQAPVENVQVNWWFFGRNVKSGQEIVIKEGSSKKLSIASLGKQEVSSGKVTSIYEDEHAEQVKSGSKGKNKKPQYKTVPASGEKFTGYAVQVVAGGQIVAEHYSAPSFKERLAGKSN